MVPARRRPWPDRQPVQPRQALRDRLRRHPEHGRGLQVVPHRRPGRRRRSKIECRAHQERPLASGPHRRRARRVRLSRRRRQPLGQADGGCADGRHGGPGPAGPVPAWLLPGSPGRSVLPGARGRPTGLPEGQGPAGHRQDGRPELFDAGDLRAVGPERIARCRGRSSSNPVRHPGRPQGHPGPRGHGLDGGPWGPALRYATPGMTAYSYGPERDRQSTEGRQSPPSMDQLSGCARSLPSATASGAPLNIPA